MRPARRKLLAPNPTVAKTATSRSGIYSTICPVLKKNPRPGRNTRNRARVRRVYTATKGNTMRYRGVWSDTNSVLAAWWFAGIALGGTFALGYPAFIAVWENILAGCAALSCVAAPFIGVWTTRTVQRYAAKTRRKPRLRGPAYADYAYIL